MSMETNSITELEISNVSLNLNTIENTGKKQRKQVQKKNQRAYRGLRKPRSDNPELWAIYNAVHEKGIREKRLKKQPTLSLIDEQTSIN